MLCGDQCKQLGIGTRVLSFSLDVNKNIKNQEQILLALPNPKMLTNFERVMWKRGKEAEHIFNHLCICCMCCCTNGSMLAQFQEITLFEWSTPTDIYRHFIWLLWHFIWNLFCFSLYLLYIMAPYFAVNLTSILHSTWRLILHSICRFTLHSIWHNHNTLKYLLTCYLTLYTTFFWHSIWPFSLYILSEGSLGVKLPTDRQMQQQRWEESGKRKEEERRSRRTKR